MDFFGGQLASASIVSELIGINFADCEVVCLRKAGFRRSRTLLHRLLLTTP